MDRLTRSALDAMGDLWVMMGSRSGGRAARADGMAWMATGLPYAPCNQAIINDTEAAEEAIAAVLRFYDEPPLPFMLQVWEGSPAVEAAKNAGLVRAFRSPLMTLSDADAQSPAPLSISIRRADAADLASAVSVACGSFQMEREAMEVFLSDWMLSDPQVGLFVAAHGEQIVGTAIGVWTGDVVGVFNVATLPAFRRRGIGEALTTACIRFGADNGARGAFLQASAMGRPVYERMGFREVGYHIGFSRKG